MRTYFRSSCALLLALAARLPAQCVPIACSGCPSAPALGCLTPPRVGMPLQLSSMICLGITYRLWVLGLPSATPIVLAAPITCGSVACGLGGTPVVLLTLSGSTLQIPNDPTLIAGSFVLQEGSVGPVAPIAPPPGTGTACSPSASPRNVGHGASTSRSPRIQRNRSWRRCGNAVCRARRPSSGTWESG